LNLAGALSRKRLKMQIILSEAEKKSMSRFEEVGSGQKGVFFQYKNQETGTENQVAIYLNCDCRACSIKPNTFCIYKRLAIAKLLEKKVKFFESADSLEKR
jgi:hypothetical protein